MASGTSTTDALGPGERPLLVVILGPTAVGKTARAIELAQALGTEIINADSRQIYKGMSIGTAQPTATEREMAAHHFVDFINVEDRYSAGQFEADTMSWLNKWFQSHKTAVMSGGSGLYLKAVLDGLDEMPVDLDIRSSLNARHKKEGVEALAAELAELDPAHAANMDLHNPQRVIRALEVCLVSGKPFSSFHKKSKTERPFDVLTVGLQMNRDELVNRINLRVDNMVQEGLKHEGCSNAFQRTPECTSNCRIPGVVCTFQWAVLRNGSHRAHQSTYTSVCQAPNDMVQEDGEHSMGKCI